MASSTENSAIGGVTTTTSTTDTVNTIDANNQSKTIYFGQGQSVESLNVADNLITNCRGIHGIPYQYMSTVDRRLNQSSSSESSSRTSGYSRFGRMYTERIVTRMPLLLLTPGEPDYLAGVNKDTKQGLLQYIADFGVSGGLEGNNLQDLIDAGESRSAFKYFTLKFAYADYYKYVNSMLRTGARYLGIHLKELPERNGIMTPLWKYDWTYYTSANLPGVLTSKEYVAFYVESEDSISESFSNNTTESMLASTLNKGSELFNELGFLLGTTTNLDTKTVASLLDEAGSSFKSSKVISKLLTDAGTIVTGGKILFPEIWSDSSFSKSYSIEVKLVTPDADKFSWYCNIFVPLCHLICLCAPRQVVVNGHTNPNAYAAPFLIRAFYKGAFSVDMGIIDSMSISKGSKGSWTLDGLPREVNVSFSIKDLYQTALVISKYVGRVSWALFKNSSMTDYIATACGINVNKPDIQRSIDLFIMQRANAITDIPSYIWSAMQQRLSTSLYEFLQNGKIVLS